MARIGVFICHCGTNIAGTVNISEVVEAAKKLPMVAYAEDNKYTCSDPGQASIREAILKHHLDRVVVASCSPRMHEITFRRTVAAAGLNPYLLEMANIREQCSWVHSDKEAATNKAIEIVKMAVAKVRRDEALFPKQIGITKRALVIGGGIAGMQAALDIGNAGYEVALVEREPTIGGRMAQLDKTFPTLDCSACILTPKMVDVGRHPNITLLTYSEVESVEGFVGNFKAKIKKKARYVDENKCTACGECLKACPVDVPSEFEMGLGKHKAIYISFPQAVPNKYAIEKKGISPCRSGCPADTKAQAYVALISQRKFKEALDVIRETLPFPLILGRVCHHPCESECNRKDVDEPISIRDLKRFVADWARKNGEEYPERIEPWRDEKVAVVGAGPAGLTCALKLLERGYNVTVFEASDKPGGMITNCIGDYRIPKEISDYEIDRILARGIELRTNINIGKDMTLEELRGKYNTVFIAIGTQEATRLPVEGVEAKGVLYGLPFLRDAKAGRKIEELGEKAVVLGGGNVATDCAKSALRAGVKEVHLVCLETRDLSSKDRMRAFDWEIEEIEEEGVIIHPSLGVKRVLSKDGRFASLETQVCTSVYEEDGRFSPKYAPEEPAPTIEGDTFIIAIGQRADLTGLEDIEKTPMRTIKVNPITLETNVLGVFAGGDIVRGPASVVEAIADGNEAAISIDRFLNRLDLEEGRENGVTVAPLPERKIEKKERVRTAKRDPKERCKIFEEIDIGLSEDQAIEEASRCLNCATCSDCRQCEKVCEAEAINYEMQDEHIELDVGAIIMATGYHVPDSSTFEVYGGGKYPDVITALQLERLMSSFGPTQGEIVRPSDGTHPKKVVFIGCVGSRDEKTGNGYCSRVCCMYMAKHAIMLKEHDPEVQSYVFYPSVRGPGGKMFEDFLVRAQEEAGAIYLRGEINEVYQEDKKVVVCGKDLEKDESVKIPADLVVLAVGMNPSIGVRDLARVLNISYDERNFMLEAHPKLRPVETATDGVFLAGTCLAPSDIPESVAQGGAAAAQVVTLFAHDTLSTEPMVAAVDPMKCVGCLLCADVCPFNAIESQVLRDGRTVAIVNESVCKGCGLCVSACRSQAVGLRGFSPQQLFSEVMALWR